MGFKESILNATVKTIEKGTKFAKEHKEDFQNAKDKIGKGLEVAGNGAEKFTNAVNHELEKMERIRERQLRQMLRK